VFEADSMNLTGLFMSRDLGAVTKVKQCFFFEQSAGHNGMPDTKTLACCEHLDFAADRRLRGVCRCCRIALKHRSLNNRFQKNE
jgi:uncharacterized paraquat-inducible protein A